MFWHVVAFEGCSGHPSDWPRLSRAFVRDCWLPVLAEFFEASQIRYCSQRDASARAAAEQAAAQCRDRGDAAVAVVGFSNGGHAAVQFAHILAGCGVAVRLAFTADPIPRGWGYLTGKADALARPANVQRWVNVYQRSDLCSLGFVIPLKGYPILGADENTELRGLGPRGHVHLPGDERVLARLHQEFKAAGAAMSHSTHWDVRPGDPQPGLYSLSP